jgi:hypothetical protein
LGMVNMEEACYWSAILVDKVGWSEPNHLSMRSKHLLIFLYSHTLLDLSLGSVAAIGKRRTQ